MSFSFDASKNQANTTAPDATTAGALPTFSFGTGGGDAAKPAGFSLIPNQNKPGGLFGANLSTTQATGFSFGTPSTAAPAATTTTQATGLTFGATPTPSTNIAFGATSAAPATGFPTPGSTATGFSLGAAATTTPTTGLTFGTPKPAGGFALGGGEAAPAGTSTLSFGTPTAGATGIGFGLGSATTAAATTSATGFTLGGASTAAATTAVSTGFSLGATTTTSGTTGFSFGTGTTTITTSGFGLNKTVTSTAPSSLTAPTTHTSLGTTTTVSSSTSGPQLGAINFCQLEESINKWTLELEEQEKVFLNQAAQINAWDKLLITNGEKIVTLNQEVERVKIEQQQLEHELDYVVGQQKELQDCLVPLEKELASLSVSDPEREYTYRLAENLDTQLKQMSEDLKEIIERLNEAYRTQDSNDPIVQIGKILNAHIKSLQWLDQQAALLSQKIQQIEQMHQNFRQENERSFSLAYN